jgi:FkbM family methyltransferase
MDIYVPLSETRFVDYNIGGYHILAPHFLADKHPRSSWETARFQSMERHLRSGMVLFDIGAENGSMSAIYSRFVGGGENMCLFEPVPQVFPNIKATWEANGLAKPRATWCGFVGAQSWNSDFHDFPAGYRDGWPECAYDPQLLDATKFRYDHEHHHCTDSITIDAFVRNYCIVPDAITMDVEGYEPTVIAGAINTLRTHHPLLWISVHRPTSNNILYKFTGSDHVAYMEETLASLGYRAEFIAEDHESHFFWYPV